ncbi:multiheme c-type cytochrome [Sorangium sp. So ce394]|uniref:multiheme c-type cytochrome n=1 Tax=Sorangium sp. So ce394 TaxID=3133310 RepID=UPI003F5B35CA
MKRSLLRGVRRGYALLIPFLAIAAAAGAAACQGCKVPEQGAASAEADADAGATRPTVRLYVLSTVAGALEPCGCTKDQLGGIDHLAALIEGQRGEAPARLVVGAGPLLFMEPEVKPERRTQDAWKAEAMALAAKEIGLAAWAPGENDWALGAEALAKYQEQSGAAVLAKNLEGAQGVRGVVVRDVSGVKVGLIGVSDPKGLAGAYPDGVKAGSTVEAVKAGVEEAKKQGATVFVGLAALPRGEALRLADNAPELHVLVLGKPSERGDVNDGPKPPVLIGTTLVVETPNHLQSVAVVDLFVRGKGDGPLVFADAGGVAKADELISLSARIRELEIRLNGWEGSKTVSAKDIADRKADLEKLRAEKAKLESAETKVTGSFFRYSAVEVREKLGADKDVAGQLLAYYKRVNAHNKEAFADRVPEPPAKGEASYIGIDACTNCHDEERKVFDGTAHARAYATLQQDFKEYNLDCVSCHVTGYGKPGGSTVTHNASLQNVQCEECHGPGSLHAKDPEKKGLIVLAPSPESCVTQCHHPPHVEGFEPMAKMQLILGPGHGRD